MAMQDRSNSPASVVPDLITCDGWHRKTLQTKLGKVRLLAHTELAPNGSWLDRASNKRRRIYSAAQVDEFYERNNVLDSGLGQFSGRFHSTHAPGWHQNAPA
eukprot:CAMPEP_0205919934 /NCGR_PEP_ID=MMETSP1325-20131115/10755_1 /ASSEMBLY_ACC=CAM_ASM_000708 /TAXON_ID=236786 /ORGANISM="Florenciella sp., Strain RCC1007" /LENGTH=101 /DNA_ID=CAMNT_0053287577 /DNA_START=23 /DNA_END=324 /DNA_ORIENTATION=-